MGTATAISPADGPVAVTGASGYIGSWSVRDLLTQGYRVHACVRDTANPAKIEHLEAMASMGLRGELELFEADLTEPGSYDEAFDGCTGVFHIGAGLGFNRETPQEVYDHCHTEVQHVIDSARKSGALRRFVFTSSFAAVAHVRPPGYVFTEKDWCSDNREGDPSWTEDSIATNRDIAYAMAKANTEKLLYETAATDGSFEAVAILPLHVIGPLMTANHDQGGSWQNGIRRMLSNKEKTIPRSGNRMLWNVVDVRDVALAHRLAAESGVAGNGSRYILSATDRGGELFTWQLQAKLQELFPHISAVSGEEMNDGEPATRTYDSPRSYCLLARDELGLPTHDADATIRATGDSYLRLGLVDAS